VFWGSTACRLPLPRDMGRSWVRWQPRDLSEPHNRGMTQVPRGRLWVQRAKGAVSDGVRLLGL